MGVIVTMLDANASRGDMHEIHVPRYRERSDISLDKLSEHEWRVCDRRVDEHDAPSVLGIIERTDEGFEILEIGSGAHRFYAETLDEAVAVFVVPVEP